MNLVAGEWYDPSDRFPVVSPADGSLIAEVGRGGTNDAGAAADAAADAADGWAATPARARADVLLRAAQAIAASTDELGVLLAREAGKRLPEAVAEVRLSAEYFRWFAEQARQPSGSVHSYESPDRRHLSVRLPAGVTACLTPWNFPCSIQARKLAAALAAGCTVVARVSEKAPLAVTEMVRLVHGAGLPAGVLNLVHGPAAEITDAYLEHSAVRVVSFTGSTTIGRQVMAKASERIMRPLLELGGDAAFVVFDDVDIDATVDAAMVAKFRNTGQSCIAANRFLVHEAIHDAFVGRLAARIDAMSIGDGLGNPVPDLAPCIDHERVQTVTELVDEAVDHGGRLLTGIAELPTKGSFCAPALVANVPDGCTLATDEVFGPAAGVFRFADEDEAVARANATELGLATYMFTTDASRVWRLAERIEAGIVGVNNPLPTACFAPMGGTKQSGLGREGGELGIEEFQDVHYLAMGL